MGEGERTGEGGRGAQLVGRTPVMLRLCERLAIIAASDAPVLITGESGTGKELVARTLHDRSPRRAGPWVVVNCAAFPEALLEAELFGHERGAFTGAVKRRDGRFKAADGGTLFLDEVSELPLASQTRLLRVIAEGTVQPLGGNAVVPVDVRIVSASQRPLKELVAARRFREDLYYRLNVLDLRTPSLRERKDDLAALVEHFLARLAPEGRVTGLTPAAWAALAHHDFPGNVRELEHAIHHAIVLAGEGLIDVGHLPDAVAGRTGAAAEDGTVPAADGELLPLAEALRAFEREYLLRALAQAGGHRGLAAARLGIARKTLWEKLRAHGVQAPRAADEPEEGG